MPYMGVGFGLSNRNKMLVDGYEDVVSQSAKPETFINQGSSNGSTSASTASGRPMKAVAISVPGNIVSEEAPRSEADIVEELFDDLSIFELMDFGRSDTVLGLNVMYKPIKNISDIYFTYNPKNILALAGGFTEVEASTSLRIGQYSVDGSVSIDPLTGDLIIAVENMKEGFSVQVELLDGVEIQDS